MSSLSSVANMPKYAWVARELRSRIRRGVYPEGGRIPSVRELAAEFGVTTVTIAKALELLESEAMLSRQHGRGTFVAASTEVKALTVGIIAPMEGHFFGPLFGSLVASLQHAGHRAVPCACPFGWERRDEAARFLAEMNTDMLDALFIDADAAFPLEALLPALQAMPRTVYVFQYQNRLAIGSAQAVVADFRAAGYMAAARLIAARHRVLVPVMFRDRMNPERVTDIGATYSSQYLWFEGISDACRDAGLDPAVAIRPFFDDAEASSPRFEAILEAETPGVLCMGDHRALRVYQICARRGWRIGTDLSIIGLYNTPWTEMLSPHLTSVSLSEKAIAATAVAQLSTTVPGSITEIAPKLVERGSVRVG